MPRSGKYGSYQVNEADESLELSRSASTTTTRQDEFLQKIYVVMCVQLCVIVAAVVVALVVVASHHTLQNLDTMALSIGGVEDGMFNMTDQLNEAVIVLQEALFAINQTAQDIAQMNYAMNATLASFSGLLANTYYVREIRTAAVQS